MKANKSKLINQKYNRETVYCFACRRFIWPVKKGNTLFCSRCEKPIHKEDKIGDLP